MFFYVIFILLAFFGFFATIGTGIAFLITRSKAPKLLKKGFYTSVGLFVGSFVMMFALGSLLNEEDETRESAKSQEDYVPVDTTAIEEETPPVFSYDDESAIADEKGNFSVPISVESGYTVELQPSSILKSTGTLEKQDDTNYTLVGTVVPEELTEMFTLVFKKDGQEKEDNVFIDNELLNTQYGEQQLAAVKEEEDKEAVANEKSISYGMLNKSRDGYVGKRYHISKGQVLQAEEADGETNLLVNISQDGYGFWDNLVHVRFFGTTDAVDNDIIEVYGIINEKLDYDTKIGGTNSVPSMDASEIKVLSKGD